MKVKLGQFIVFDPSGLKNHTSSLYKFVKKHGQDLVFVDERNKEYIDKTRYFRKATKKEIAAYIARRLCNLKKA